MIKYFAGAVVFVITLITYYVLGVEQTLPIIQYTTYLIQAVVIFFTTYFFLIGFHGFRKRRSEEMKGPEKRFAVLVAAHNEEAVIGDIVENLQNLNYPKELYDIFVICDNCKDNTAKIVRSQNGKAMERFDESKKGKGYALEWMFEKLWKMEREGEFYDAVVMFDADNLVDPNFLTIMNRKLLNGHDVIQGYLDSKNPNDSWITKSYSYAYWVTNRIYQLARKNLGLSAQLGGTGVVVTTNVLKDIGWGATSLTEDLEFSAKYIMRTGKPVEWAHEAVVYDEKPLGFVASWKQRVRWMQGHSYCMMHYSIPMIKKAIKERKLIYLDALIYLVQPSKILLGLATIFFGVASSVNVYAGDLIANRSEAVVTFFNSLFDYKLFLLYFCLFWTMPFISLLVDKKYKQVFWLPFVYLYSLTWLPITLIGFIKRNQKVWVHTQHTRKMSDVGLKLGKDEHSA